MIEFYLMIVLMILAFLYMGNKALKTFNLSNEVIDLTNRMDRLESEIVECFKIAKEDLNSVNKTGKARRGK